MYDKFPLWVTFEPTNICNLKCSMCHVSEMDPLPKGYTNLSEFQEFIDSLYNAQLTRIY